MTAYDSVKDGVGQTEFEKPLGFQEAKHMAEKLGRLFDNLHWETSGEGMDEPKTGGKVICRRSRNLPTSNL